MIRVNLSLLRLCVHRKHLVLLCSQWLVSLYASHMGFGKIVGGQTKEKTFQLISGYWNTEEMNHRDVKRFIEFGEESILGEVLQILWFPQNFKTLGLSLRILMHFTKIKNMIFFPCIKHGLELEAEWLTWFWTCLLLENNGFLFLTREQHPKKAYKWDLKGFSDSGIPAGFGERVYMSLKTEWLSPGRHMFNDNLI